MMPSVTRTAIPPAGNCADQCRVPSSQRARTGIVITAAVTALACRGAAADATIAWAADMAGPYGFYSSGTLPGNGSTTITVNIPQFPADVLPASLFGALMVTVTSPGGNGFTTGCVTVRSSGGGCNLNVCDGSPQLCFDALPYSNSTAGTYAVTLSNANWLFSGPYTVNITQFCASGAAADANACVPPVRGWPPACVADLTGLGEPVVGLNGCGCGAQRCDGLLCCWDGSQPSSFDLCPGGVGHCLDCATSCPAAPSPSATPSPSPSPGSSQSPTPVASASSSASPSAQAAGTATALPSPSSAADAGSGAGLTIGTVTGPGAVAIVAALTVAGLVAAALAYQWWGRRSLRQAYTEAAAGEGAAAVLLPGGGDSAEAADDGTVPARRGSGGSAGSSASSGASPGARDARETNGPTRERPAVS
jgi:hypothetical protein